LAESCGQAHKRYARKANGYPMRRSESAVKELLQ